jgi:phosphopantetheine adenylyltransferase
MGSYSNGYFYEMPKRGLGQKLETDNFIISPITKKSALEIQREMIQDGIAPSTINITKNIDYWNS